MKRWTALTLLFASSLATSVAQTQVGTRLQSTSFDREAVVTVKDLTAAQTRIQPDLLDLFRLNSLKPPSHAQIEPKTRAKRKWKSPPPPPTFQGGDPPIALGANFMGVDYDESGAFPPSPSGSAGPTQLLVYVSGRIRVYSKTGVIGALDTDTQTFWASVLPPGSIAINGKVIFDPTSGRWIVVAVSFHDEPNHLLLAFSSGPTITNSTSFTFKAVQQDFGMSNGDTGQVARSPSLGVDANAIYIGCNMQQPGDGLIYSSSGFIIPKTPLFAGLAKTYAIRDFVDTTSTFTGPYFPVGVTNFVAAAQGKGFFIGHDYSSPHDIDIITVNNPGTTPTSGGMKQVSGLNFGPGPIDPQPPGSLYRFDGGQLGLYCAAITQNAFDHSISLLTSQEIGVDLGGNLSPNPAKDALQWYFIDPFAQGGPALLQTGIFSSKDNSGFLYPSVAINARGDLVSGYSQVGPSMRPQANVARKMPSDSNFLETASAANSGTFNYNLPARTDPIPWGQYSSTFTDPTDGLSIWTLQEFVNGTDSWAIQVTRILAPQPPTLSTISPSSVAQGYTGSFDIIGTASQMNAFVEPSGQFAKSIQMLLNNVPLTGVTPVIISPTHIQINVKGLSIAAKPYAVTVANPDGQIAPGSLSLRVFPGLLSFTVDHTAVTNGNPVDGTATVSSPAPSNEIITLATSSGAPATVPTYAIVPSGQTKVTFPLQTKIVTSSQTFTITASDAGNVHRFTVSITVNPSLLSNFTLNPSSIAGGWSSTGTITLASPAGGLGSTVKLSGGDALVSYPATVTVPARTSTASFFVTTSGVSSTASEHLAATIGSSTKTATLTLVPATLNGLGFAPASVTGGASTTGYITLAGKAGPSGVVVSLAGGGAGAKFPPTVTVPAGTSSQRFTLTTVHVASKTTVTITAKFGVVSKSATVTIN